MTRKVNLADVVGPLNAADFSGKSKARAALGLENVENTADMDKPVSRATQAELDTKAPLDSPAFTGKPTGIDKSHVGLGNVDNTSDAEKPISAATRKALDGKAEADHTHDFSDALASLAKLGEAKQQDTRIALGVPAKHFDTVGQLIADKTVWPEGARLTAGDAGYLYRVAARKAEDHQLITAGGTKLYVVADRITPDQFGADPSGKEDSTEAFNAAMQFCVKSSKSGYSSGLYRMSGTLTPGGRYAWDWGNTRLMWGNVSTTDLTEVFYNPKGSSTAQPSGKYVLFDTADCTAASNLGILTIIGVNPGNMRLANRSKINPNVIAITASKNSSADMTWGTLIITGCGYGLFQGDQRGTARPNILPYTRWKIQYLRIQMSIVPFESGFEGDGFDDLVIDEFRTTQVCGQSAVRSSELGGGVAFLNGLAPDKDMEPGTIATTANSTTAILSEVNPDLKVGHVIVIGRTSSLFGGANLSKSGTPLYFATRIKAIDGTKITLERAAEATTSDVDYYAEPPEVLVQVGNWRFQQTFVEEIHKQGIRLFNRSGLFGLVKISNGDYSSLYDCGYLITADCTIDVTLHEKGANCNEVKSIVGVGSYRNSTDYSAAKVRIVYPTTSEYGTVNSDPVRIVSLYPGDAPGGYSNEASSDNNSRLNLSAEFANGTYHYQQHGSGCKIAYKTGGEGGLELGTPLMIREATAEGGFSSPVPGSSDKTIGAEGQLWHYVVPGKTYRVSVNISAAKAMAPQISFYNGASFISNNGVILRKPGRAVGFYTIPESGVNRIALRALKNEHFTVDEFSATEVLSL